MVVSLLSNSFHAEGHHNQNLKNCYTRSDFFWTKSLHLCSRNNAKVRLHIIDVIKATTVNTTYIYNIMYIYIYIYRAINVKTWMSHASVFAVSTHITINSMISPFSSTLPASLSRALLVGSSSLAAAREIRKQIWAAFLVSWVLVSHKKLINMVNHWSRNWWKRWPDLPLELCTRIKQWPCATSVSSNWKSDVGVWDLRETHGNNIKSRETHGNNIKSRETHGNNIKSEKCCSLPCPLYDWCKYTCIFLPCGFAEM